MLSRGVGLGVRCALGGGVLGRSLSVGLDSVGGVFTPTEEHGALRSMVRSFVAQEVEPQAEEFNGREAFNSDLFRAVGDLGLLGVTVPTEFGGAGMDATAAVIVHEELSASDPAFALSFLAHSMLFANNLAHNGSKEQCERYLPDACSGRTIGGMGMTEPGAGTDVLGMRSSAVRDGDDWVLNGSKMWITNGAVDDDTLGDIFLIYARTSTDKGPRGDYSLFLVEKGMPGFRLGQRIKGKCGMRASATAELVFEDVRVPQGNVVGEVGDAMLHMMRNLELERLTLAAMSLGIARRSIDVMNAYCSDRTAFGSPIRDFGQMQRLIAESYASYAAGRHYVYNVASALDLSRAGNRLDSDGVKLFCSTMGKTVADNAVQALGGYGYVAEYNVERLWRDAKLLEIGGGTLEAHHKNMTRELKSVAALP